MGLELVQDSEGYHPQESLVSGLAKDYWTSPLTLRKRNMALGNISSDFRAVSQNEIHFPFWCEVDCLPVLNGNKEYLAPLSTRKRILIRFAFGPIAVPSTYVSPIIRPQRVPCLLTYSVCFRG